MKEWMISLYLFAFKALFGAFKSFRLQNKATFVVSFPDNAHYIYREMKRQNLDVSVVFLCQRACFDAFKRKNKASYVIEGPHLIHMLIGIYHLATSRHVIVDNYYGFLAATKFKETVTCTQVWHAVGAIKQFGIEDPSNAFRSEKAIRRFKSVYARFDQIVVGSDFMGEIFQKAFLKEAQCLLKTGVPRTDFFFDESEQTRVKDAFYVAHPDLKEKKIILYAPTFRKEERQPTLHLDFSKLEGLFEIDHALLLKFHPHVAASFQNAQQDHAFVLDCSMSHSIQELMAVADVLVTDYSSIPMEFALLKRPMIFFPYDLETYKKNNGLWEAYEASVPGPIVKNMDELIHAVLHEEASVAQLEAYAQKWASYCKGDASAQLVKALFRELHETFKSRS